MHMLKIILCIAVAILWGCSAVFAASGNQERNPFTITSDLMKMLTDAPGKGASDADISLFAPKDLTLINGLPHISLQAVSMTRKKRSALLKKKDGSSILVAEGDRLYLIEQGKYVEMKVLEIKPRSIRIQLGPQGQIIEVQ